MSVTMIGPFDFAGGVYFSASISSPVTGC
jgi:hypothetical protein